jgi:hypothetical protein
VVILLKVISGQPCLTDHCNITPRGTFLIVASFFSNNNNKKIRIKQMTRKKGGVLFLVIKLILFSLASHIS